MAKFTTFNPYARQKWKTLDGRIVLISKLSKSHVNNILWFLQNKNMSTADVWERFVLYKALCLKAEKWGVIPHSNPYIVLVCRQPILLEIPWKGYKFTNRAKCRKCGDVVVSKHVHDCRWCKCGAIAVDGGFDYSRRVGDPADFVEHYD